MSGLLAEEYKLIMGLPPVADAFSGTVASDIIDMADFERIAFVQITGVGTTGTSTVTVEASDDVSASNVTAVAFYSRSITAGDVESVITARAATGYATVAGSNRIEIAEVREDVIGATGYHYVRAKYVEVANDPVLGGILVFGVPKSKTSTPRPSSID